MERARLGARKRAQPTSAPQVAFRIDRSGGWGSDGRPVWKTFGTNVRPVPRAGDSLRLLVGCTAPTGRTGRCSAGSGTRRVRRRPWKPGHGAGAPALALDGARRRRSRSGSTGATRAASTTSSGATRTAGTPCTGSRPTRPATRSTRTGACSTSTPSTRPTGPGWRRENGFVSKRPDGTFCYGFVPHRPCRGGPPDRGRKRYRLATSGPGVTPDVAWEGPALARLPPGRRPRTVSTRPR